MKRILALLYFCSGIAFADGPIFQHKDTFDQQEFENVYQNIHSFNSALSGPFNALANTTIGIGPVTGATAIAGAGGGLSSGTTYYYKIFPVQLNGYVGIPSPEMSVLVQSPNGHVNLSWSPINKANQYYITQGTCQGCQSGYYTTTNLSISDTGQSFSGSVAATVSNSQNLTIGGTLTTPASFGGINTIDYVDGSIYNMFSMTSAGELQYQPGKNGANKGVHYFQDSTGLGNFQFGRVATGDSELTALNGASLNVLDITVGGGILLRPNNVTAYTITGSAFVPNGSQSLGTISNQWQTAVFSSATFTTGLTSTGTIHLIGTSDGSNAPAGYQGEYGSQSTTRSSALALTTGGTRSISTATLTAGDWDVTFACGFTGTAPTTQLDCATSQTANTFPAANTLSVPNTNGEAWTEMGLSIATVDETVPGPCRVRVSSNGSTTLYLVARAVFGSGSASAYGSINYRRAPAH